MASGFGSCALQAVSFRRTGAGFAVSKVSRLGSSCFWLKFRVDVQVSEVVIGCYRSCACVFWGLGVSFPRFRALDFGFEV